MWRPQCGTAGRLQGEAERLLQFLQLYMLGECGPKGAAANDSGWIVTWMQRGAGSAEEHCTLVVAAFREATGGVGSEGRQRQSPLTLRPTCLPHNR